MSRIPEKCKESKDKRTELERDALFLCKKHTVKYGLEVENYADYAMPKEFVGSDPIKFQENVEDAGRYVVTNEEERTALEGILGSDFGIAEWQNGKAIDCIFFIEVVNVSSSGYDIKREGILC